MSNLLLIVKTLLLMQFKTDKSKKRDRGSLLYSLILAIIVSSLMVYIICENGAFFVALDLVTETVSIIMFAGFIFVLIYGTVSLLSVLFSSKDTEFLMSLPVSASTIFFAKLIVVYLLNIIIAFAIIAPGLITLGVIANVGAIYYIMVPIVSIVVPILPLLLASFLALPLMFIISKMKNKGMVSTILVVVLLAVFMVFYMIVINSMSSSDMSSEDIYVMLESIRSAYTTLAMIIYPHYAIARVMTMTAGLVSSIELSMIIDSMIFIGSYVLVAFLLYIFSGKIFKRAAKGLIEVGVSKVTVKKEYVQSNSIKALIKRDFREVFRNTSVAVQCVIGAVFMPIIVIVMGIIYQTSFNMSGMQDVDEMIWMIMYGITLFMISMSTIYSQNCISLDGKSYVYNKVIPVSYVMQIKAKKIISMIFAYVPVVLSLIAIEVTQIVGGNYNPTYFLTALIGSFTLVYAIVCINIYFDLAKPSFSWTNPLEILKGGKTLKSMLINMLICILGIAIYVVVVLVGISIGQSFIFIIFANILIGVIGFLVALYIHKKLNRDCDKLYSRI